MASIASQSAQLANAMASFAMPDEAALSQLTAARSNQPPVTLTANQRALPPRIRREQALCRWARGGAAVDEWRRLPRNEGAQMIHLVIGNGRHARQVKVPFFMLALMGGAALLFAFLFITFVASLALFAIPAIVIGTLAARWFGQPRGAGREPVFTRHRRSEPNVIEGEYRVLDAKEPR